jgi:hypothetical protein
MGAALLARVNGVGGGFVVDGGGFRRGPFFLSPFFFFFNPRMSPGKLRRVDGMDSWVNFFFWLWVLMHHA